MPVVINVIGANAPRNVAGANAPFGWRFKDMGVDNWVFGWAVRVI